MNSVKEFDEKIEQKIKDFREGSINMNELKVFFFNELKDYADRSIKELKQRAADVITFVSERYPDVTGEEALKNFNNGARAACELIKQEVEELN